MGCVLSAPVELIRVQRHGSTSFKCAVAEMQGWRVNHEDAHEMRCNDVSGSFWVLDGHGGDGAALLGAPDLVQELDQTLSDKPELPSDDAVEHCFETVDGRLRAHMTLNPEKESGTTVVGALIVRQADDTYSMKLVNCGDSRGIVVRSPAEEEHVSDPIEVRVPQHLDALTSDARAVAQGEAAPVCRWPLIAESVDHKPNHPTERARIEAAGGKVRLEEPARLDGNLAVSRGLGDFDYKIDSQRPVQEQKVSCIPDVYEASGLKAGSICVLGCDGVWDVMSGNFVGNFVRDALIREPNADLGSIAAELIRACLQRNSRDNVTVMIVHFVDGSSWTSVPDEMKHFDKLGENADMDGDIRKQYVAFLQRSKFPTKPCACAACNRWVLGMSQCPCEAAFYCSRHCQKKGWRTHKSVCTSVVQLPA